MAAIQQRLQRRNIQQARMKWGRLDSAELQALREYSSEFQLSIALGDLIFLGGAWYVTHAGLLRLARRKHCYGIKVEPVTQYSDTNNGRYAFKATVYTSRSSKGFVGHGDADPSNVSPSVHGAEMRVAETRAVNRALRKAYGIGICSIDELGSLGGVPHSSHEAKRLSSRPANGNGFGGPKLRDRLCQIIRQHQLDPTLVKSYATDFCGVKTLGEASREQVENFVMHLTDWVEKDRNALLCQLNSYLGQKEGAA
jgi:hypothetical protein